MDFVQGLRRALITLWVGGVLLIVAGPWALYRMGLGSLPVLPQAPQTLSSPQLQRDVWQRWGGQGEPELVVLDPVSYVMSAAGQNVPPPSTLFAWRVASAHTQAHLQGGGKLGWNLATSALTIWVTRHWTLEQLLSEVSRLDAANPAEPRSAPASPPDGRGTP